MARRLPSQRYGTRLVTALNTLAIVVVVLGVLGGIVTFEAIDQPDVTLFGETIQESTRPGGVLAGVAVAGGGIAYGLVIGGLGFGPRLLLDIADHAYVTADEIWADRHARTWSGRRDRAPRAARRARTGG